MASEKKGLAVLENFQIVSRYDGMTEEEIEELKEELEDLDPESGIVCRKIKIPSGGGTSFEVQDEEEDDYNPMKTITGVVVFTHRLNGYWPNAYGSDSNKLPACSSMDGKTGLRTDTGETIDCASCPHNEFGTAKDQAGNLGKGKACKNMRRLYILMDGDPNLYLLTVPPTSIKAVNDQLSKLLPYTKKVVTLSLEKTTNAGGTPYSRVIIKKTGVLPPAAGAQTTELRRQINKQYEGMALTFDDFQAAPQAGVNVSADDEDFQEAPPFDDDDCPFM